MMDAAPVTSSLPRGQRRLWLAQQLDGDGRGLLVPLALRISGHLDVAALRAACTEIVRRHEVLRTCVVTVAEEPTAVLRPAEAFELPVTDAGEHDIADAVATELFTEIDIRTALPIRARLFRLADDEHVLCLTVHHIAFDGWSIHVLYDELAALYGAGSTGAPNPLPALPAQYRDVALAAETRLASGERLAGRMDYWRRELAGATPFELPTDRPRPTRRRGEGFGVSFTLPDDVDTRLTQLARQQRCSPFTALLAAAQVFCYRYSGRADVITGTSCALRDQPVTAGLIGLFLSTLVLRTDLSGNPTFTELVGLVHRRQIAAYANRHVPFDMLVDELAPERDLSRPPLFGVLVDTQPGTSGAPALPGLVTADFPVPRKVIRYDVEIEFDHTPEGALRCHITADTGLYRPDTVCRWRDQLTALLTALAADPGLRIDDVPILSAAESIALRDLAAPAPVEFPQGCLHELFHAQAIATPDAIAVTSTSDTQRLTYRQVDAMSDNVAHTLAARGVAPDDVIGVMLDRSPTQIPVLLGVLKAGAAFLPIETDCPPLRVARLLTGAHARLCVTRADLVDTVTDGGTGALTDTEALTGPPHRTSLPATDPAQLCSVYCTSGSTGEPKRVANTHAGWVNRMSWMQRQHPLAAGETVLYKTTLTFDDSAVEVFWPLLAGATTAVLGAGLHRDPRAIIDAGIRSNAVHVQFVPSMLDFFLDALTGADLAAWPGLRSVLSSGEALRPELVRRFLATMDGRDVMLDNTWGATEVSIDSTCHVCGPRDIDPDAPATVSLGRPIDNNEVHVLDHLLRPVPLGTPGELYIGGAGLARGYLHDPRRTAAVFVPHPDRPGDRLYRTGDHGRMRPDGTLEFLGRTDDQVKIRGVRVELGEIRAALLQHPGVMDAVATVSRTDPADVRVVGYVVLADDDPPTIAELHTFLTRLLTGHTMPGALVAIPRLPLLPSGKLDLLALPSPTGDDVARAAFVAPGTATEQVVAAIWSETLAKPRVSATDDFFALGGHSLLAIRVTNRMRRAFGIDLSPVLLFERRTVAAVAALVEELVLADIARLDDDEAERLLAT